MISPYIWHDGRNPSYQAGILHRIAYEEEGGGHVDVVKLPIPKKVVRVLLTALLKDVWKNMYALCPNEINIEGFQSGQKCKTDYLQHEQDKPESADLWLFSKLRTPQQKGLFEFMQYYMLEASAHCFGAVLATYSSRGCFLSRPGHTVLWPDDLWTQQQRPEHYDPSTGKEYDFKTQSLFDPEPRDLSSPEQLKRWQDHLSAIAFQNKDVNKESSASPLWALTENEWRDYQDKIPKALLKVPSDQDVWDRVISNQKLGFDPSVAAAHLKVCADLMTRYDWHWGEHFQWEAALKEALDPLPPSEKWSTSCFDAALLPFATLNQSIPDWVLVECSQKGVIAALAYALFWKHEEAAERLWQHLNLDHVSALEKESASTQLQEQLQALIATKTRWSDVQIASLFKDQSITSLPEVTAFLEKIQMQCVIKACYGGEQSKGKAEMKSSHEAQGQALHQSLNKAPRPQKLMKNTKRI